MTASNHLVLDQHTAENFGAYNADCVDFARGLPSSCIDFSIYSLPFAELFVYSDSLCDLGNCANYDEFMEQYAFEIAEKLRVTRPGRLTAVHCKDLLVLKGREGYSGLRDFPGHIIEAHRRAGWAFHSRVVIRKDPVVEMQRTKAHGLLYKTLRKDSTFSRQGLADYLLVFRKWPQNEADHAQIVPVPHDTADLTLPEWQRLADPVWMHIDQTDVLNVQQARQAQDEKHLCPLQLGLIADALKLWSNPGDVVWSPFMGIGSEGVVSLRMGRKFIGTELKAAYWRAAVRHLLTADAQQDLFAPAAMQAAE